MVNVESVTSVRAIIDSFEKFNLDYLKENFLLEYPLICLGSKIAALDIFQNYMHPDLRKIVARSIIDYHSNKAFMLGYWSVINAHNNKLEFSNESVKNLTGEELYSRIDYIKISILINSHIRFSSGKSNGLKGRELIKLIKEVMNEHLAKIFMAGYMVGRMKENIKNNEKNKALGM